MGVAYPLIFDRRFPGGYVFMFLTMSSAPFLPLATTGQVTRKHLGALLATLSLVAIAVSYVCFAVFTRPTYPFTFHCVCAVWLAAYVCFAIGLGWRAQQMPSWLCYLGRISYSIIWSTPVSCAYCPRIGPHLSISPCWSAEPSSSRP